MIEWHSEVFVADRLAQRAQVRVVGDQRCGGGVGAFDHAGVAKVGEPSGSAADIGYQGAQHVGYVVVGVLGQESDEFCQVAAAIKRGKQAGR